MATEQEVKAKLDALTADVAGETTVIASLETLLDNLTGQIKKLQDAATSAQVNPAIVNQIEALGTTIATNKQRITDDVTKNTPAAPPTPAPAGQKETV